MGDFQAEEEAPQDCGVPGADPSQWRIDILAGAPHTSGFRQFITAVWIIVAFVVFAILVSIFVRTTNGGLTSFAIFMAVMVGFLVWREHRWRRKFASDLAASREGAAQVAKSAVAEIGYHDRLRALRMIGREFLSRNWCGYAIRIAPRAGMLPAPPLQVQIEPLALCESDEGFVQLQQTGKSEDKSLAMSEPSRRLRRSWRMVSVTLPAFTIFIIHLSRAIFRSIERGRVDERLLFLIGLLLLAVLLSVWFGGRQQKRLLAVNAGLLYRKSRWKGPTDLYLFRRESSVLCVFQGDRVRWHWIVQDQNHKNGVHAMGTAAEAQMLIRAWSSSLAAPQLEQMSDFAA